MLLPRLQWFRLPTFLTTLNISLVLYSVHHRTILCFDGCQYWKFSLALVGSCEMKEDFQSFPAEVTELPSNTHQKFCVRLPRKRNVQRSIRYNVCIVFFTREKSRNCGANHHGSGSVTHLSLTASENYLENLDCRLTRWSLIVLLVSTLFSSRKSFKREDMSKPFRSSDLTHKPNFPINAFTLSALWWWCSYHFPCIHSVSRIC